MGKKAQRGSGTLALLLCQLLTVALSIPFSLSVSLTQAAATVVDLIRTKKMAGKALLMAGAPGTGTCDRRLAAERWHAIVLRIPLCFLGRTFHAAIGCIVGVFWRAVVPDDLVLTHDSFALLCLPALSVISVDRVSLLRRAFAARSFSPTPRSAPLTLLHFHPPQARPLWPWQSPPSLARKFPSARWWARRCTRPK